MAGKSSRFPGLRPKWMLTHPKSNRFMVTEAISGLNLDLFDKVFFICLKSHEEEYSFKKGLLEDIKSLSIQNKSELILLEESTESQSETVKKAIDICNIKGSIFIKDSDGYFEANVPSSTNCVAYYSLNNVDNINARSKSYVDLDSNKYLTNIVEKNVISSTFCVGGYGFKDTQDFINAYKKLSDSKGELYISHIIFEMLMSEESFLGFATNKFIDWGTIEEWNNFKSKFKCLFLDIDGTLITNSSKHFPPYIGEGKPLVKNIELIKNLCLKKYTYVILTTSRSSSYKEETLKELEKYGIPYDQLIMDLPHCQRTLVNDYSLSNPFPTATSINLLRNNDILSSYFN